MTAGCTVSFLQESSGRTARHHALNDLIAHSFASAGVPVTKEPVGLFRTDGRRPDGLTLIPWQSGKSLCWDVTVTCLLAASYIEGAARQAGSTAEMAASRNRRSILRLRPATSSSPLRWKLGRLQFLSPPIDLQFVALGHRISSSSGEARETCFLFQRISVLLQRFNAVLYSTTACACRH